MPGFNVTDEILWERLRQDDEEAFSLLFERYYQVMVRYGQSLTSPAVHARDGVQDVFADVWLYRRSLREVQSVKAYLFSSVRKRVARQHERDHIFRQTSPLEETEFSMEFTVQDQLIADEEMRASVYQLNQLINALPARQKEALFLRYHHNIGIEQIAEMMHINYQSVVNLLYRAIRQLRSTWIGELPFLFLTILCFLK